MKKVSSYSRNNGVKKEYNIEINDTRIYCCTLTFHEKLPYILYLNGGPGNASCEDRILFETMDWRLNTVFVDQRGCGRSMRTVPLSSFAFSNLSLDLSNVLDALHLKSAIVLGHSWGGVYGLDFCIRYPKRVHSLIAVSMVDSWRNVLNRFYQYGELYAKMTLRAAYKLLDGKELEEWERTLFERYCSSAKEYFSPENSTMKMIHQNNEKLNYELIIRELEKDIDAINRFCKLHDPWKGWNARAIRHKYPFYLWNSTRNQTALEAKQRIRCECSAKELEYSSCMEEGLSQNPNWGLGYCYSENIERLTVPLYYLYGKHDVLFTSPSVTNDLSSRFGSDSIIEFNKSSHSPHWEEPLLFKKVVERLYQKGHLFNLSSI